MRVLVVSPHYDDAPLSVGESLLHGDLRSERVTVGIVFGRSNWVRYFHPTNRRWPVATAIRLMEEGVNAFRFRYRVRVALLPEWILRTGIADSAAYLDQSRDVSADPLVDDVYRVLLKWSAGADLVLVPLGIGGHVDHLIVAAAGRRLADAGRPIRFYEDRPYACWLDDDALTAAALVTVPHGAPSPISGPIGGRKRELIWYPSQVGGFFDDAIGLDETRNRCERVWE
jgi:hypothetical protein